MSLFVQNMMACLNHIFKPIGQQIWRSRLVRSLILALAAVFCIVVTQVQAAETVRLQYREVVFEMPLTELEAFIDTGTPSDDLQEFFSDTNQDPAMIQDYLTRSVDYGRTSLIPREFGLIMVNKVIGEPLQRENDFEPLKQAFRGAIADDDQFTILELAQNYPGTSVRISLNQLVPVYRDINLLLTRISPVLQIAEDLLPELVCDCDVATSESDLTTTLAQSKNTAQETATETATRAIAFSSASSSAMKSLLQDDTLYASTATPLELAQTDTSELPDKNLVITFGPMRRSLSLAELVTFVETGELPSGWSFFLNIANVSPDDLRLAFQQELQVDAQFLDRTLNSLLGEYMLYQVGQIVHTRSRIANIQALRSAMVLSALDDNRLSFLELLARFPTDQMYIDAVKLMGWSGQISQVSDSVDNFSDTVVSLEDWLITLQISLAQQRCDCDASPIPPTPINSLQVSSDRRAEFLPANWQPVPAHREDRGNVKVVWLQGTPYEMGYQHGQLLHDEIASLGEDALTLIRFAGRGLALANLSEYRSYPYAEQECRGMADSAGDIGMSFEACMVLAYGDVYQEVFGYTLPQELFWEGCSQFVATGDATVDGYLYHGSTVDNGSPIDYIINNPIVFVRQPNDGLPHVFVTYPGVVWPNSGLNVASISMGLDTALPSSADDLSFTGASNVQLMSQILQGATTFDEAVDFMVSQPRVRPNIIMTTDGKSRQAGVFEFTGNDFAVRSLQDNDILYATNHFLLEEMYEKQAPPNSSSISRFERYEQLLEPDGRDSVYGSIDPRVMTQVLRDRTDPNTLQASPFEIFDDNASPGGNGSLRQAIFDPQRLHIWVAAGRPPVPENPFVCLSLEELLEFPGATPCPSAQFD